MACILPLKSLADASGYDEIDSLHVRQTAIDQEVRNARMRQSNVNPSAVVLQTFY